MTPPFALCSQHRQTIILVPGKSSNRSTSWAFIAGGWLCRADRGGKMLPSLIGLTTEKAPAPNARRRLRSLLAASGRINVLRMAAHRTVMGAGVCALGAIGVMFVRPEMTDHIKAMSPFAAR